MKATDRDVWDLIADTEMLLHGHHAMTGAATTRGILTEWITYAEIAALRIDTLQEALFKCAEVSGADVSGGMPTSPLLEVWAVREVEQLRKDYDEALT